MEYRICNYSAFKMNWNKRYIIITAVYVLNVWSIKIFSTLIACGSLLENHITSQYSVIQKYSVFLEQILCPRLS